MTKDLISSLVAAVYQVLGSPTSTGNVKMLLDRLFYGADIWEPTHLSFKPGENGMDLYQFTYLKEGQAVPSEYFVDKETYESFFVDGKLDVRLASEKLQVTPHSYWDRSDPKNPILKYKYNSYVTKYHISADDSVDCFTSYTENNPALGEGGSPQYLIKDPSEKRKLQRDMSFEQPEIIEYEMSEDEAVDKLTKAIEDVEAEEDELRRLIETLNNEAELEEELESYNNSVLPDEEEEQEQEQENDKVFAVLPEEEDTEQTEDQSEDISISY